MYKYIATYIERCKHASFLQPSTFLHSNILPYFLPFLFYTYYSITNENPIIERPSVDQRIAHRIITPPCQSMYIMADLHMPNRQANMPRLSIIYTLTYSIVCRSNVLYLIVLMYTVTCFSLYTNRVQNIYKREQI